jgi:hypothetical protein
MINGYDDPCTLMRLIKGLEEQNKRLCDRLGSLEKDRDDFLSQMQSVACRRLGARVLRTVPDGAALYEAKRGKPDLRDRNGTEFKYGDIVKARFLTNTLDSWPKGEAKVCPDECANVITLDYPNNPVSHDNRYRCHPSDVILWKRF